jgi:hypothetical protein
VVDTWTQFPWLRPAPQAMADLMEPSVVSGWIARPICLDEGLAAGRAASWAFATCVIPTVTAATPVKSVATRIDFLVLPLPLAALIVLPSFLPG